VTYALRFSVKAREGLAGLPVGVQEAVLDELEIFAGDPSGLRLSRVSPDRVHDFVCVEDSKRYSIFMMLRPIPAAGTLRVV